MSINLDDLYNCNLRKPGEYIAIAQCCLADGDLSSCNRVLRTAGVLFPKNGMVQRYYQKYCLIPWSGNTKVFGIGLSRTGGRSLSAALSEMGLNAIHGIKEGNPGTIIDWDDFWYYDAATDIPVAFQFETLYYAFPDAKFIHTTRSKESWLESIQAHYNWVRDFRQFQSFVYDKSIDNSRLQRSAYWKAVHANLYAHTASWEEAYDKFNERVKNFFGNDASRLCTLPITEGTHAARWKALSEFLGLGDVPPVIKAFPARNRRKGKEERGGRPGWVDEAVERARALEGIPGLRRKMVYGLPPKSREEGEEISLQVPAGAGRHYIFRGPDMVRPNPRPIRLKRPMLSVEFSRAYDVEYHFFDEDKNYLSEISHGSNPFLDRDVIPVEGSIKFIEDKFTKFNVCHFLCDKLRRLEELPGQEDTVLTLSLNKYTRWFLGTLGYKPLELEEYRGRKSAITLSLDEVELSTSSNMEFKHPGNLADESLAGVRDRVLGQIGVNSGGEREWLMITRRTAKTRRILNIEEVAELAEKKGYRMVELDDLEPVDQVRLFARAERVVGVHGAGLANMLFCKPGAKVIEILPPLCATPAFWIEAQGLGHEYDALIAEDPEYPEPDYETWKHDAARYNRRDVIVPVGELEKVL